MTGEMYQWSSRTEPAVIMRQHVIPAPPGMQVWCAWEENGGDADALEHLDVLALGFELATAPLPAAGAISYTDLAYQDCWVLVMVDCENPWARFGHEAFHTREGALEHLAMRRRVKKDLAAADKQPDADA